MKIKWAAAPFAIALLRQAATPRSGASETTIERMPAELESQFALSAGPTALRALASVYPLDPSKGYYLFNGGQVA